MSLTDNEIIKALEYCASVKNCDECNQPTPRPCTALETKDFLDLINRQKAEIEKLEKNDRYSTEIIWKQSTEIERLQGRITILKYSKQALLECFKTAKHQAIKEFAERLKERGTAFGDVTACVVHTLVDNLVKEMVGE